jgi:hypothetical protein
VSPYCGELFLTGQTADASLVSVIIVIIIIIIVVVGNFKA